MFALFVLLLFPFWSLAVGTMADQMCTPVKQECACGFFMNPQTKKCDVPGNKFLCECYDITNKFTTMGICVENFKCLAKSTSDGKLDQGLSKLGELLGKLMEMMKQQDKGGEQPQTGTGGGIDTGQCLTPNCYFFQEDTNPFDDGDDTDPVPDDAGLTYSLSASRTSGEAPLTVAFSYVNGYQSCGTPRFIIEFGDGNEEAIPVRTGSPCQELNEIKNHTYTTNGTYTANLVGATSSHVYDSVTITVADESTGTGTGTGGGTGTSTGTGGSTSTGGNSSNVTGPTFSTGLNTIGNTNQQGATINFGTPQNIVQSIISKAIQPGTYGDVKILQNGTTMIVGNRGTSSEVVGFVGTNNSTVSGLSGVARLCATRPWSSNFLSFIIPASFFDSLCVWRGYAVGIKPTTTTTTAPKTTTPVKTKMPTKQATSTKPATTTQTIQPIVDIWASPETVPLGARTSIFWNTQGVSSCIETSPDGSFSQSSLRGGASTVPLTAATTFTISCIGVDGKPYTDNVTVRIQL
jgi:hypothetical protein